MRSLVVPLFLIATVARPLLAQAPGIELTYLANMGVLIEAGTARAVIDGLHRGGLAEYAAVPGEVLHRLEGARDPFRTLNAALTTHLHRDHFDAGSVAARLRADSTVEYIAAQETVDSLYARTGVLPGPARVRGVVPPESGERAVQTAGIGITILDLPHNPTPSRRVANVGFLLDLGGLRVLHVGDADPTERNFAPHRLAARRVDVAIVPFWYLTGADDAVRRLIGARIWVATHIPPADTALVRRQVLARMPRTIVLTAPGERHLLR